MGFEPWKSSIRLLWVQVDEHKGPTITAYIFPSKIQVDHQQNAAIQLMVNPDTNM